MNRFLLLGCAVASLGCEDISGSTTLDAPDPITGDYTFNEIDIFLDLFFTDRDDGGAGQQALTKWLSSILLVPSDQVTAEDTATIREVTDNINCAAGRELIRVAEGSGNLSFDFVPASTLGAAAGHTDLSWNSFHRIVSGRIRIAEELPTLLKQATIRHELMHSLGPLGHVQFGLSALKQGAGITSFSPLDEALIEMLYTPGIQPGMSRDEAFDVLRVLARPARDCAEGEADE
ncbi:MAG: DUF2927 domain-containing protein [Gemmatimonadota bacterium]